MWGSNEVGQCGRDPASFPKITSPEELQLVPSFSCSHRVTSPENSWEAVRQIVCGSQHSVALTMHGTIWVWGAGPQLGLGDDRTSSWQPQVLGMFSDKTVISVSAGEFHNAIIVEEKTEHSTKRDSKTGNIKRRDNFCDTCASEKNPEANVSNSAGIKIEKKICKDENTGDETMQVSIKEKETKEIKTESDAVFEEKTSEVPASEQQPEVDTSANTTGSFEKVEMKQDIEPVEVARSDALHHDGEPQDTPPVEQSTSVSKPDVMITSVHSDTSTGSKMSRSFTILDENSAREYLARQMQEEDEFETVKAQAKHSKAATAAAAAKSKEDSGAPKSPGGFMMQTMTSLSQWTSMTSKALSSMVSGVSDNSEQDKSDAADADEKELEKSDRLDFDNSVLDLTLTDASDTSVNASQLSLADSEASVGSRGSREGSGTPGTPKRGLGAEGSPRAERRSVSKEPQSIRTLEAKQENIRKSLSALPGMFLL